MDAESGGSVDGASAPRDLFRELVESVAAVTYVLRPDRADEPPLYVQPAVRGRRRPTSST